MTRYTYRTLLSSIPELSAVKIRYQKLEISNDQPHIYPDIVFHNLSTDEYQLSLLEIVTKLRPSCGRFWVSGVEKTNSVLSCFATTCYHDIVRFKALGVRQQAELESENAIIVDQQDLKSIVSVEDVIKLAMKLCHVSSIVNETEYHPTFNYHVNEEAILHINGWESLQKEENLVVPIEDEEWRVKQYKNLLAQYSWMSLFNPSKGLLEYCLKFLMLSAKAEAGNNEIRQKMLTKALRGRVSLVTNMAVDHGHAFCIAILLIAINKYSDK